MKNIYFLLGMLCTLLASSSLLSAQNTPCTANSIQFSSIDCTGTASNSIDLSSTSASGIGDPGGCGNNVFSNNEDGWVTLTIPAGQTAVVFDMAWSNCSGGPFGCQNNPGLAVYQAINGDCNNLDPLICAGDNGLFPSTNFTVTITNLLPGDILLVRVWETDDQGSDVSISAAFVPPNDDCINAQPITGTGCNYSATNDNEPDSWTPGTCVTNGSSNSWLSNENGVWYTFTVDVTTPQPVSLDILNVSCDGTGGGIMQLGIWANTGTCNLAIETFYGCSMGSGTVTFGPSQLPLGDYYAFVDGDAGANCEWEFSSPQVLPIELGRFSGTLNNQQSYLKWETFSETDNEYFDVQHSRDGNNFESIGRVEGVGNTTDLTNYDFIHRNPVKGNNYYRIQQFDFDGQNALSETIVLTLKAPRIIGVYPNPVLGTSIHIDVEGFDLGPANFQLIDAAGRLIQEQPFDYSGETTLSFDLPALSGGLYFYSVTLNEVGYHGKLIK